MCYVQLPCMEVSPCLINISVCTEILSISMRQREVEPRLVKRLSARRYTSPSGNCSLIVSLIQSSYTRGL